MISSTVGLEALLYEKPVLTLGQPFYSGYGVTLDVDSFRELRAKVPELLRFRPEPETIVALPPRGDAPLRAGRARARRPLGGERGAARRLARGGREGGARRAGADARVIALFWDIDGTLLTTARAGVFSLEAALEEVSGVRTSLQGMATAGLTDYSIAEAALARVGHATDEETVQRFLRHPRRAACGVPPQARGRSAAGRARGARGSRRPGRRGQPAAHRATRRPARPRSSPITASPASSASAAPSPSARASGPRSPAARSRSRTAPTRS